MRNKLVVVTWFFAAIFLARTLPAEKSKGLGPGWLSLDSSVGRLDKRIQEGKSALEKALRINISGFFNTSYTWSSNQAGSWQ